MLAFQNQEHGPLEASGTRRASATGADLAAMVAHTRTTFFSFLLSINVFHYSPYSPSSKDCNITTFVHSIHLIFLPGSTGTFKTPVTIAP